jgi:hypothetical protein
MNMLNRSPLKSGKVVFFAFAITLATSATGCGYRPPINAEEYDPANHPDHKVDLLSQDDTIELYQMLKDTHEVFQQCGLDYWAEGGTMLGAVRSKGIIPWDDDNDTMILDSDVPKLLALRPILSDLGYFLEPVFFGHRIVKTNKTPTQVDIFLMKEQNSELYYDRGDWGTRTVTDSEGQLQTKPIFIRRDEVFPTQEVEFGPIKVKIPHDPNPYLDNLFKGWKDVAFTYGHAGQRKFKIDLNAHPEFRNPAPLDPKTLTSINVSASIKDRVPKDLKCPKPEASRGLPFPVFYDGT